MARAAVGPDAAIETADMALLADDRSRLLWLVYMVPPRTWNLGLRGKRGAGRTAGPARTFGKLDRPCIAEQGSRCSRHRRQRQKVPSGR